MRDLALRSSEEIVAFMATVYVYKEMWETAAGEVLESVREPHNIQGRYAMTAKKNREQSQGGKIHLEMES